MHLSNKKDFQGGNFTPFISLFAAGTQRPICAPQSTDMYSNIYGGLLTENIFTFDSLGAHIKTCSTTEKPEKYRIIREKPRTAFFSTIINTGKEENGLTLISSLSIQLFLKSELLLLCFKLIVNVNTDKHHQPTSVGNQILLVLRLSLCTFC